MNVLFLLFSAHSLSSLNSSGFSTIVTCRVLLGPSVVAMLLTIQGERFEAGRKTREASKIQIYPVNCSTNQFYFGVTVASAPFFYEKDVVLLKLS